MQSCLESRQKLFLCFHCVGPEFDLAIRFGRGRSSRSDVLLRWGVDWRDPCFAWLNFWVSDEGGELVRLDGKTHALCSHLSEREFTVP